MFHGKISHYRNIDGREQRWEREFSDPTTYRAYLQAHPELRTPSAFSFPLGGWGEGFDRMWLPDVSETPAQSTPAYLPESVDIGRYERELQTMRNERESREARRTSLADAKSRLLEYRKDFEEGHKDDLVHAIDEDIAKIEAELSTLA